ncbi:hypothetical protein L209DRAFT_413955 [Thermothelomyces heterothallicus CBS 203.75]
MDRSRSLHPKLGQVLFSWGGLDATIAWNPWVSQTPTVGILLDVTGEQVLAINKKHTSLLPCQPDGFSEDTHAVARNSFTSDARGGATFERANYPSFRWRISSTLRMMALLGCRKFLPISILSDGHPRFLQELIPFPFQIALAWCSACLTALFLTSLRVEFVFSASV